MANENVLELIGNTPIVKLGRLSPKGREIYAKLEFFNPGGSVKDRPALFMIQDAEKKGLINGNTVIVEPTSGNTGIGLAMVCAVKGYKLKLVMPEHMSEERKEILKAYGAELILTPKKDGMKGAIKEAERIVKEQGAFMPNQFENEANVKAHVETTAKEILSQLPSIDAFVAGVGTGGTITGVGTVLKQKNSKTKIFAVEPFNSPVLSGGRPGAHKIQGIGAGFVPKILDRKIIDEIIKVKDEDALETARRLAKEEGMLCGISSGANVWAGIKIAEKLGEGSKVLTIIPDTGERYLSTDLFSSK